MQALSPAELLEVWEEGASYTLPQRALALTRLSRPDMTLDAIADLSIGERDAALFSLRESLFGSRIDGLAPCPSCGALLEVTLDARVPRELFEPGAVDAAGLEASLGFRAPTTRDLIALSGERDPEAARRRLVARCAVRAFEVEDRESASELAPDLIEEGARAMALADPAADLLLVVTCPHCSASSRTPFDMVSFLWQELDAWATRLLQDVCTLAAAFGWSEGDILGLTPWRREFYLQLVRA